MENVNDCTPIYFVADRNIANLTAKFAKVSRRAIKLGLPAPQLVTRAKYNQIRVRETESGETYKEIIPRTVCTVEGVSPVLNGWTMVAAIEHVEGETMIHAFDKEADLRAYRGTEGTRGCDHCNKVRGRASTFVLRHEDGRMRRIGRNCLVDFIGSPDAIKWFTAAAEMLAGAVGACESEKDEGFGGGRGERVEELPKLLAWVWSSVRTFGWTSRKNASFDMGKPSTIDRVLATWSSASRMKPSERVPAPTEQDEKRATETIEFIAASTEDSEYMENLRVISRLDYVREKHMGLAASMVAAYDRELTKRAEAAKRGPSSHVGTIGERMIMNITLTKVSYSEGEFGLTTIARFHDDDSNDFVWFASGEIPWLHVSHEEITEGTFTGKEVGDVKVGTRFTVKATVKKHTANKFNNRPETILSRVQPYTPPAPKTPKPRRKKGELSAKQEKAIEFAREFRASHEARGYTEVSRFAINSMPIGSRSPKWDVIESLTVLGLVGFEKDSCGGYPDAGYGNYKWWLTEWRTSDSASIESVQVSCNCPNESVPCTC